MDYTLLGDFPIRGNLSLFSLLKEILMLILSHIILVHSPPSDHNHDQHHHDYQGPSSPSSMMVVPVLFLAESIKRQLPVMSYSIFLQKSSTTYKRHEQGADDHDGEIIINDKDDQDCECVVCMNRIEPDDEVRVPINCCHVFHRECLDGWVDQGKPTCPLCRSKLVATTQSPDDDDQGDHGEWR